MRIHGFNKLTLLDYPQKVACTIFTGHCNFRCPFCQNAGLVLSADHEPVIEEEEVLAVLRKRKGIVDGVCISGGEPTLSPGLKKFIGKIKDMNYLVKLDTNGYRPDILEELIAEGLLDYVAMDIKNCPDKYSETAGIDDLDIRLIRESVSLLMCSSINYEFRTTVVRELHKKADLRKIGQWIKGCRRYYLQTYCESDGVIKPVFSAYSKEQMYAFEDMLREDISEVAVRGI